MDLIDPQGNIIEKEKSKAELDKILADLAPKNKEQERILAQAIGKRIEAVRKAKMNRGIKTGFNGTFANNLIKRKNSDGFNDDRDWRLIAKVPNEMLYVARQIWGDDVLTNPEKFKEAFVEDELGQLCLTVDPKTI